MSEETEVPERAVGQGLEALLRALETVALDDADMAAARDDLLNTFGLLGQLVEVAHAQHSTLLNLQTTLQQLIDRLVEVVDERAALHALLVQLRELARKQVAQLDNVERALGMTQGERAALRDVRPEET